MFESYRGPCNLAALIMVTMMSAQQMRNGTVEEKACRQVDSEPVKSTKTFI